MTRTWVYQRIINTSAVMALAPGGVHASTSTKVAPDPKPFIMYRMTSDVESFRGDDGDSARQDGYMIFVHDVPGDYLKIDRIMKLLRWRFRDVTDQASGIIRVKWLEVSEDFRDEDMGTIMKFARLQVQYKTTKETL